MVLSVIIVFYAGIGLLAAAGSIFISQKIFSARGQQIFFALFFVAIAGFYLAFTAYFGRLKSVATGNRSGDSFRRVRCFQSQVPRCAHHWLQLARHLGRRS